MSYYDNCAFPKPKTPKKKKECNGYKNKAERTCAYTGTAPEVGFVKLVSAGGGSVKKDNGGREYLVLKVDTAASTLSFIM